MLGVENEGLVSDGKYSACAECPSHCCVHKRKDKEMFTRIGLLPGDVQKIRNIVGKTVQFFSQSEDGSIEIMWKDNDECVFLTSSGCKLEENKPLACVTYPYALVLINGECYIVRDLRGCYGNLSWEDEIEQISRLFHDLAYYNATDIDIYAERGYIEDHHFVLIGRLMDIS